MLVLRPPRRAPSVDPLASAIAAELNAYTNDDNIRDIIVQVDGHTRFERYDKSSPDQYRSAHSMTKTVMSTLIGIAIQEGRRDLDDRPDEILPGEAQVMSPRVAGVTLRQLLTMTEHSPVHRQPLTAGWEFDRVALVILGQAIITGCPHGCPQANLPRGIRGYGRPMTLEQRIADRLHLTLDRLTPSGRMLPAAERGMCVDVRPRGSASSPDRARHNRGQWTLRHADGTSDPLPRPEQ